MLRSGQPPGTARAAPYRIIGRIEVAGIPLGSIRLTERLEALARS